MATNENFDLDLQDEDAEDFVVDFGEVTDTGGGGTSNFNDLSNRPKYDGQLMTGETNIPKVPSKTSDLTNDSDYQTGTEVDSAIDSAIGELNIPTKTSDLENDSDYQTGTEVDNAISTAVEAEATARENADNNLQEQIDDKQDTLTAGENITIENNVISAIGGGGSVTTLTGADFNYPINNPDGIAMWLLPDGDYVTTLTSEYIYPDNASSKMLFRYFSKVTSGNSAIAYYVDSDNVWKYWNTNKNTGARISFGRMAPRVQQSSGTSQTDVMSQDATTKLVDGRVKQNAGAPTTSTIGTVGQLYEDTTNGKLYQCTAVSGGTYTWEEVGAGGGGGITPVQTTGTSTTDVMSQDATSKMVFNDPGADTQIRIGANAELPGERGILIGNSAYNGNNLIENISIGCSAHASVAGTYNCIAIGSSANSGSHSAIAIGRSATVGNSLQGSIALGAYSTATRKGELNIGTSWNATGFNNTAYRVIGGVHDGQDAHDVVTVEQLNATIDAINSATGSSIPHVGA